MAYIIESKNKKIKLIKKLNSKLGELHRNNTNTKNDSIENKKEDSRRPSIISLKKSANNNSKSNSNLIYINDNNPEEEKTQKPKFILVKKDFQQKSNFLKNGGL